MTESEKTRLMSELSKIELLARVIVGQSQEAGSREAASKILLLIDGLASGIDGDEPPADPAIYPIPGEG